MESNFNNKDFEQFVKQNADQYRMFPSEKVWDGINNTLHTRRRWYGIGLTLLLLTTGVVTWVMLLNTSGKKQEITNNTIVSTSKKSAEKETKIIKPAILAPAKPVNSTIPGNSSSNTLINLFPADFTTTSTEEDEISTTVVQSNDIQLAAPLIIKPEDNNAAQAVYAKKEIKQNWNNTTTAIPSVESPVLKLVQSKREYDEINLQKDEAIATDLNNNVAATEKKDMYPLTIESVVNSYQKIARRKGLTWQIYFLPTVSYRKLTENKSFITSTQQITGSSPLNYVIATGDVNNVVTHKPDIGFELGFNVGYPISRKVKLTTGLQLNISKYDIKAYPYQTEPARLALTNDNGSASISTIEASYRNFETYTKPDWLSNFYISASLPVGLEVTVTDPRKTYLGIGGTVQPTYILGDRAYLISADFKNYAEVPSLIRGWNVSTSFEVFAGYTTGKIKWKVGPQVRYQMLSSFAKKYPVKEHIMDFGLKVGVMLR
jgi:hypothetical protein